MLIGMAVGAAIGAGVGSGAGLLGAVTADGLVDSGVYTYETFESRALAPHSDGAKEYYYRPIEEFKITSGKAASWFGSNGGAMQFVKYKPDGTKFSIQEMINLGMIEDITEKVKKGVVKID